ncbi:acyl-CoA dehydrogenase family protein [bacterium]|nr:acyl-CoA dehydrogenase family protein [bacterium]
MTNLEDTQIGQDPFASEEEATLRQAVREFCLEEVLPITRDLEKAGRMPRELFRKFGEMGLLGITVPEEYGGGGAGMLQLAWVIEEVSRIDAGVGLSVSASNGLATSHILKYADEETKQRFVPKLCSGELIGCWGLTEPSCGTDAAALKTRARRDGDHYVLNGRKSLITHAILSDVAVVMASTDPEKKGKGISAFVLDKSLEGFGPGKHEEKLGMCASETGDLVMQDCRAPVSCRMGEEGEGYAQALTILDGGRIGVAAISLGIAQGALDASLKYVDERETFGHPISKYQAIRFKLAEMATKIHGARLMIHHAAMLKDSGKPLRAAANMAKLFATEMAVAVCEEAIQIHGGYGYTKDFLVEKFWRDSKLCTIGEGTSEVQRMLIARELLNH